jgi:hypothetical protein
MSGYGLWRCGERFAMIRRLGKGKSELSASALVGREACPNL